MLLYRHSTNPSISSLQIPVLSGWKMQKPVLLCTVTGRVRLHLFLKRECPGLQTLSFSCRRHFYLPGCGSIELMRIRIRCAFLACRPFCSFGCNDVLLLGRVRHLLWEYGGGGAQQGHQPGSLWPQVGFASFLLSANMNGYGCLHLFCATSLLLATTEVKSFNSDRLFDLIWLCAFGCYARVFLHCQCPKNTVEAKDQEIKLPVNASNYACMKTRNTVKSWNGKERICVTILPKC